MKKRPRASCRAQGNRALAAAAVLHFLRAHLLGQCTPEAAAPAAAAAAAAAVAAHAVPAVPAWAEAADQPVAPDDSGDDFGEGGLFSDDEA